MITSCIGLLTVYAGTILGFFRFAGNRARSSEPTVLMIVNMFVTLFGLTLMLVSLPLSRQASETYMNLSHRCDYSDQTHRTFEYWTVLHNIRSQPECATATSVEECDGYEQAPPYTTFLKTLESEFRCSGFCWKPAPAAPVAASSTGTGAAASAPAPAPAANGTQ